MIAGCPLETVKENGSRRWPGTVEGEKLPFAMRLQLFPHSVGCAAAGAIRYLSDDDANLNYLSRLLVNRLSHLCHYLHQFHSWN
jgi:hypothetical protein